MRVRLVRYAAIVAAVGLWATAFMSSCGKENDSSNSARLSGRDTVEWVNQTVTLQILSQEQWTVSGRAESGGEGWYSFNRTQGSGRDNVQVRLTLNEGDLRRVAITVNFGSTTRTVYLTQREYYDESTQVTRGWFEIPAGWDTAGPGIEIITHFVPEKREMRNFTIKYNTDYHYPEWVAYPMHRSYHPQSLRTNEWAWDPKIPTSKQANMTRGMGIRDYSRGHMIPSASRTINAAANKQTFYCTNLCIQNSDLNAGVWENLESKVRTWSGTGADTLYVVTGAVLSDHFDKKYLQGETDKPVGVPDYYYKALVNKKGSSYNGIAFWYNKVDIDRPVESSDAMSIKKLEELTGEVFFPALPSDVAEGVKGTFNPNQWGLQ